ncbi:hypothetical protein LRS13_08130 [Svornostia abyssi]|uniref:GGDEF domain-containing protein n=1 Tax=Svornostia abyssi TaxID=2898438 RepID=A0ABY5PLP6_9ACTN|nr:hypothetical protein LRS13_08130 [Parviterribacteraceae bacterium J379]
MAHDADVPADGTPPRHGQPDPGDDEDRLLSDADQAISDSDQTLSDLDQTASDEDQILADFDQASADLDQHASDRDQATADRDAHDRPEDAQSGWAAARYAASRADRLSTTLARYASSLDRFEALARRDAVAMRRDETAAARDEAASARDRPAARRDEQVAAASAAPDELTELLTTTRMRAGIDRERAARDRRQAAMDRVHAATDRQFAREALRHAHHDELTGTLNRAVGERALAQEIDRARTGRRPLTLALVVVDTPGPDIAGVAATLRRGLRSFDTIVRFGDDTFVCAVPDEPVVDADRRFAAISEAVADEHGRALSIGTTELLPGDTLGELIARADDEVRPAREQSG